METDYSSLFESKPGSVGALHVDSAIGRSKGTGMSKSPVYFGLAQAQLLAKVLTKRQLPGLNSINQLYLLAIADTVASTNMDLESGDSQERGLNFARRETSTGRALVSTLESLQIIMPRNGSAEAASQQDIGCKFQNSAM